MIKNSTNIPSEVIEAIAARVCPPGAARYTLRLRNRAGWLGVSGYAYRSGPVSLCIGEVEGSHTLNGRKGKGYLTGIALGSRAEAILFVLAHELRHRWQHAHRKPRVYGSRGRYSERDADAYALGILRQYRRGEIPGLAELMARIPKGIDQRRALEVVNAREADLFSDLPKKIRALIPAGATRDGDIIDAPRGFVWSCHGAHGIIIHEDDTAGLASDLRCGLDPCEQADCDMCHPEEEQAAA